MKRTLLAFGFFLLLGICILPVRTAQAGALPNVHPPFIQADFCGTTIHYSSSDFPANEVKSVLAVPTGGGHGESFTVGGSPSGTLTASSPILYIEIMWGDSGGYLAYFFLFSSSCPSQALIDMYVYFSGNPFYGNTHTLTIFSAAGFPSKNTVTMFVGGSLPGGFSYGAPACWAMLYDDGSDRGSFACDAFLSSVGERRASLRNDPEGSGFDLLPKILAYLKMLDNMN